MTNSDPSPLHPGSFGVPGQGLETNGGWRGGGVHCPNSGPLFTLYTMYSKDALLDREEIYAPAVTLYTGTISAT